MADDVTDMLVFCEIAATCKQTIYAHLIVFIDKAKQRNYSELIKVCYSCSFA